MSTTEKVLVSEQPAESLLEASLLLVREKHLGLQTSIMNNSPILNQAIAGRPEALIFDIHGLKDQLANAEQGFASNIESLRGLWRSLEYHCKINGKAPERTLDNIKSMNSENIAELAILAMVRRKEVMKLRKKVQEIELQQKNMMQRRRLYLGAVKRARKDSSGIWQISQVDGMMVDEKGMISELNMHVDEYLAECRKRRQRRQAA